MEIMTSAKEVNLNLFILQQEAEKALTTAFYHLVESLTINNDHIEFLRITTQNTVYYFARLENHDSPFTRWHVINGKADIIGKTVHLFGVNQNNKMDQLNKGEHLGIYLVDEPDALPRYTSEISDLAVVLCSLEA
jgi:hypothetical protein